MVRFERMASLHICVYLSTSVPVGVINISFQASIEARSCRGMLLPSVVVLHLDMNISHCNILLVHEL
jgi:hypothetical protein